MIGIGTTVNGGFAEYCIVKEKAAYRVPEELSFDEAAMMKTISCCLHGIDRSNIRAGDTVAITGSFINPLVAQRVIDLLVERRIDMSKVITDRVPLEDSIKVFTNETYRNSGKIVIGDF